MFFVQLRIAPQNPKTPIKIKVYFMCYINEFVVLSTTKRTN